MDGRQRISLPSLVRPRAPGGEQGAPGWTSRCVAPVLGTVGVAGSEVLVLGGSAGSMAGSDPGSDVAGTGSTDAADDPAISGEVTPVGETGAEGRADRDGDRVGEGLGLVPGFGVWFFVPSMTPAIATPPQQSTVRTVSTIRRACSVFGLRRSTSSGFGWPVGETAG